MQYNTPSKEQWQSFDCTTRLIYLYMYWKTIYNGPETEVTVEETTKAINKLADCDKMTIAKVLSGHLSFCLVDDDLLLVKNNEIPEWMQM